jgi:hypothetical protein
MGPKGDYDECCKHVRLGSFGGLMLPLRHRAKPNDGRFSTGACAKSCQKIILAPQPRVKTPVVGQFEFQLSTQVRRSPATRLRLKPVIRSYLKDRAGDREKTIAKGNGDVRQEEGKSRPAAQISNC